MGRDERRVRGQLLGHHPDRSGVPRPAGQAGALRVRSSLAASRSRTPTGGHERRHWRRSSGDWRRRTTRRSAHFTDSPRRARLLRNGPNWRGSPRSEPRAPTTSCGRRSARSCSTSPPTRPSTTSSSRLRELHAAYRDDYRRLLRAACLSRLAGRCGAPIPPSCSCPASACSPSEPTSRRPACAGEFYVNAINVMRGAESVSTYAPIPESEKFRIEYWALEEAKLRRRPAPRPLATRVAFVTGAGSGIGRAIARRPGRRGRLRRGRRSRRPRRRRRSPPRSVVPTSPCRSPST